MRFEQKRKYNNFFLFFLFWFLLGLGISFLFYGFIDNPYEFDEPFLLIVLVWTIFLVLQFLFLNFTKEVYIVDSEFFTIKKAFQLNTKIANYLIKDVRYNPNDKAFLFFGKRSSIKIVYGRTKMKTKIITSNKPILLFDFLKHESNISMLENPDKAL